MGISQYFHNIVFHLSESKRSKVIAIESSSQSTLELSTTILSTKLVNQNRKPFNMSTIVANPVQPEATKIEKLEAKLASFEESSEKEKAASQAALPPVLRELPSCYNSCTLCLFRVQAGGGEGQEDQAGEGQGLGQTLSGRLQCQAKLT